jgi:hypothetical protein
MRRGRVIEPGQAPAIANGGRLHGGAIDLRQLAAHSVTEAPAGKREEFGKVAASTRKT